MKKQLLLLAACTTLATANAQNDPGLTVGSTGTVDFTYMGNPVTYITVRGADNLIWLQQNLGATQVATSSTDAAAYGHYFQWGRWDDGHQVPTSPTANVSTITPNNPAGILAGNTNFLIGPNPNDWWGGGTGTDTWSDLPASATNGTDPCTAIGPGWHMPTTAEFTNAITVEGITNEATGFSSNLKLAMAGQRDGGNGMMINVGAGGAGQFWTANANMMYADNISVMPSSVNNPDLALRGYGFSVRCVTTCTGVFPPDDLFGDDTVCAGSTQTYYIHPVANANDYTWTVPTGWTIVGPTTDTLITVVAGSTGGAVTAQANNSCNNASLSIPVEVNPLPVPVISATDNSLSTGTFTSYQWMVNDTIITGATTNPYTATESGDYQVIVTDVNGCSDTSVVFAHTLGVNNIPGAEKIRVYPNPAVNMLHIDAPMNVTIAIYSIDGRVALTKENATTVDISALPAGTYHVKMTDKSGQTVRMEKLTVIRQ
jgi:hypothetical protein